MARLASSGNQPTSGGFHPRYQSLTRKLTKAEAASKFGRIGAFVGPSLVLAAWGVGLGIARLASWEPGVVSHGLVGGGAVGVLSGLATGLWQDRVAKARAVVVLAIVFGLVAGTLGVLGGTARLLWDSWFAWPVGGVVSGILGGLLIGLALGE